MTSDWEGMMMMSGCACQIVHNNQVRGDLSGLLWKHPADVPRIGVPARWNSVPQCRRPSLAIANWTDLAYSSCVFAAQSAVSDLHDVSFMRSSGASVLRAAFDRDPEKVLRPLHTTAPDVVISSELAHGDRSVAARLLWSGGETAIWAFIVVAVKAAYWKCTGFAEPFTVGVAMELKLWIEEKTLSQYMQCEGAAVRKKSNLEVKWKVELDVLKDEKQCR